MNGTTSTWCARVPASEERPSWMADFYRRAVFTLFEQIREGEIALIDGRHRRIFGQAGVGSPLRAELRIHAPAAYRRLALGASIGAGEGYMNGDWSCDDLTALVRIFVRQLERLEPTFHRWSVVRRPLLKAFHWLRRNTAAGSRRNIADHYDLGNDFFAKMLDPTMSYSSGIFERPNATLEEASIAKMDRICRKLELTAADHLLEIGTGWGGLAMNAARKYGCRVTTTTISRRQFEFARDRVRAAGLEDRVTLLLEDYRALRGRYDKCVSVEMIEAVGHQYYDTFFAKCGELLRPSGLMLLQAITIGDHRYEQAKHSVDFIKRYIFPGSCIPSVARMLQSLARRTDLRPIHLEDITPHYATTLRMWRENLFRNWEAVRQTGVDERFLRMWTFYLCYCEAGFAERYLGDVHLLLAKPGYRGSPAGTLSQSSGANSELTR